MKNMFFTSGAAMFIIGQANSLNKTPGKSPDWVILKIRALLSYIL